MTLSAISSPFLHLALPFPSDKGPKRIDKGDMIIRSSFGFVILLKALMGEIALSVEINLSEEKTGKRKAGH
ncbi:Hypothetical protein NTJ_07568 [Nesidiocoris tenuis]|uniref:Uncharacterized protein n=1 Tax=Nesidiocoris tenuis TaxID=355587 RepID=A0ABN7ATF1_9HEMI|nr:Hypothetical protein NTJ_07568 [Nesidiocoris tenuis]